MTTIHAGAMPPPVDFTQDGHSSAATPSSQTELETNHNSNAIEFTDPVAANDSPSQSFMPSANDPTGGMENDSPIDQVLQMLMMIMQMLLKIMGGENADDLTSGENSPSGASGGSGGASGAGAAGGSASSGGPGKELSMENGELQIGEDWGGWDGVAAGELNSSHDVEDRGAMVNLLKENYGMSDGEAEQVTTALHSASRESGLDATKGVHSDAQAAEIKEQNHANIKEVFASVGPGANAADFVGAISNVYGS